LLHDLLIKYTFQFSPEFEVIAADNQALEIEFPYEGIRKEGVKFGFQLTNVNEPLYKDGIQMSGRFNLPDENLTHGAVGYIFN